MDVGQRISKLREAKGITTNKLANLSGISQSYLREIELGKKNPTVEILSYICESLKISLSSFFIIEPSDINLSLKCAIELMSDEEQERLAEFILTMKSKK